MLGHLLQNIRPVGFSKHFLTISYSSEADSDSMHYYQVFASELFLKISENRYLIEIAFTYFLKAGINFFIDILDVCIISRM